MYCSFFSAAVSWFNDPPCHACQFWIQEIKGSLATGIPVFGIAGKPFPDEILEAYQSFINFDITLYGPLEFSLNQNIQNLNEKTNILHTKINEIYEDRIWPKVESVYGDYTAINDALLRNTRKSVVRFNNELFEDIRNMQNKMSLLPVDYNPPRYSSIFDNVTDLDQDMERFNHSAEVGLFQTVSSNFIL